MNRQNDSWLSGLFCAGWIFALLIAQGCSCDDDKKTVVGNECNAQTLCTEDKRCENGYCIPWEDGAYDSTCTKSTSAGVVRPRVQCYWSEPPEGDGAPTYTDVYQTPLVANLGIEINAGIAPRPNIVIIASDGTKNAYHMYDNGILRIIDGATCLQLGAATTISNDPLVDERVYASVTPAAGDINGDGRTDVVAMAKLGGLIAFTWDPAQKKLVKLWKSKKSNNTNDNLGVGGNVWGGISLVDLNDDGKPEIVHLGAVWSPEGVLLSTIPGWANDADGLQTAPVLANVDADPAIELVSSETVWQWDTNTNAFVPEHTAKNLIGWSAIADFGTFDKSPDANAPEIVRIAGGHIYLLSLAGDVLRDFAADGSPGGPPTVADYDGDGKPEIGAAFPGAYVSYDAIDDKELWRSPSKDASSGRTGSSVFDFNGDGKAEVVYADECYVRVYDGTTGEVQFSQSRRSGTWNENPVVADVDGDYAAEIVVANSTACDQTYCGDHNSDNVFDDIYDPVFKGLRCDNNDDCKSKQCSDGFCRCSDNTMCDAGYGCSAPLANTPGEGNVCRSTHTSCKTGVYVFRDGLDDWSNARSMWNQHAYFITNVNDDGTIPRSSDMKANWTTDGLNNFRQNVPAIKGPRPVADLTIKLKSFACASTAFEATVCNRGAALADLGVPVNFNNAETNELICTTSTDKPLSPGECGTASCEAATTMGNEVRKVTVSIDLDPRQIDCKNGNNASSAIVDCAVAF